MLKLRISVVTGNASNNDSSVSKLQKVTLTERLIFLVVDSMHASQLALASSKIDSWKQVIIMISSLVKPYSPLEEN
jgi:hypothetical protein